MRHVRLESEGLWPVDRLEQLEIPFPAVHAAPADLPLRREPFAERLRDTAGFAEGVRDLPRVAGWIPGPFRRARGRIDADHAGPPNAEVAQCPADFAGLTNLRHELLPLRGVSHGGAAAGRRPHR